VVQTAWPWKKDIDNEKRTPQVLVKMKSGIAHRDFRVKGAEKELRELGLKDGDTVLDFESGTGIYTIAAAKAVGGKGTVHAVDVHPAALEMLERKSRALGLTNVDTIYSDLDTGLNDSTVDFVIFYDVLKGKKRVSGLLLEACRVIKPKGFLLIKQPGMKEDRINEMVLKDGFFSFSGKQGGVLRYAKILGCFREVS
jgi:ubiquinone/menaquinone biosynthesis C-methylase UbiE